MSTAGPRWAVPLLLAGSLAAGLLLGEGAVRLAVEPVNYLMADPVFDSVLGARLPPHASGHDAWGFRNREVPDSAEVVTIGDSQTYGIGAPGTRSWPAQLAKMTGRRVYNAALGGYSPVQYEELLRRYALRLRPRVVVVGVYFGNDLWEAHRTVYGLPHWSRLRRPGQPAVEVPADRPVRDTRLLGPQRTWLAHHSVLYRMATGSLLGAVAQRAELATQGERVDLVAFAGTDAAPATAFTPAYRLRTLDLDAPAIQEGLRLSLDRTAAMADDCRAAGVRLLVVLIPTKERVYQPWIEADSGLRRHPALARLLRNESEADRRVQAFLTERNIPFVDVTEPLRDALRRGPAYPPNQDGHPNAAGYGAIAAAVSHAITPFPARTSR